MKSTNLFAPPTTKPVVIWSTALVICGCLTMLPIILAVFDRRLGEVNTWIQVITIALVSAIGSLSFIRLRAERERANAQLRTHRHALQNLPVPLVLTDMKGHVIFVNEAFEELTGKWANQWDGKSCEEMIDTERTEADPEEILRRSLSGGWQGEVRLKAENRKPVWASLLTSVIRDPRQRPQALAWTLVDITDWKEHAEDVEHLAQITQHSGDAVVCCDGDQVITSWNHGAELMFGYARRQALGHDLEMLVPEDLRESYRTQLNTHGEQHGMLQSIDTVRLTAEGIRKPVHMTVSSLEDATGSVIGHAFVFRDVSSDRDVQEQLRHSAKEVQGDLKHAERHTQAVEAQNQQLLRHVAGFVLLAEPDGKVTGFNEAVRTHLGYTDKEVAVMRVSDFHPREEMETVVDTLNRARKDGNALQKLTLVVRSGGEIEAAAEVIYLPELHCFQLVYSPTQAEDVPRSSQSLAP